MVASILILFLALAVSLTLAINTIDDTACNGTAFSKGFCYLLQEDRTTGGKKMAKDYCESRGMRLASMEEEDEFDRFMEVAQLGECECY